MTGPSPAAVIMIIASAVICVLLTAGFTVYQVQLSNHRWCTTLSLLTAHPVPSPTDPAANPSRLDDYRLYRDFVDLKGQLGC
jgi:hypothetical protein